MGLAEKTVLTGQERVSTKYDGGTNQNSLLPVRLLIAKEEYIVVFDSASAVTVSDGVDGIPIGFKLNGYNLVNVVATVHDKGITGTTDIQIRRRRAGADVDMLSTPVTIGDEWFAQDGVINLTNDDVQTGDILYVDRDAIHSGTAPNGLSVRLEFEKS